MAPPAVSAKDKQSLEEAVAKMVRSAPWKKLLQEREWVDLYMPSDQFTAFLEDEQTRISSPEGARPGLAHRAKSGPGFPHRAMRCLQKGEHRMDPKSGFHGSDARIVRKSGRFSTLDDAACKEPRPRVIPGRSTAPCHPRLDDAEAVRCSLPPRAPPSFSRCLGDRSCGAMPFAEEALPFGPVLHGEGAWADRDRPEKPGGRQNERPVHFIGRETVQGEEEGRCEPSAGRAERADNR